MKSTFPTMADAESAGYTTARRGIIASAKTQWGKLNLFSSDVSGGDSFGYAFATRVTSPLGWSDDDGDNALLHCVSVRELRSETIRLTEDRNRMGRAGCYATAYLDIDALIAEFHAAVAAITPEQFATALAAVRNNREQQDAEWASHEASMQLEYAE